MLNCTLSRAFYSKTLSLPKTSFPMKANSSINEPKSVEFLTHDLYKWNQSLHQSSDKSFLLHDGPPYANGRPHVGHAMNKVLKDITLRSQFHQGQHVLHFPGWDCHGLPIELKALDQSSDNLEPIQIRKRAAKLANKFQKLQQKEFQRWGSMGDWDNTYQTLHPSYEVEQLKVFQKMYNSGLIYRAKKPVYWSPWTKTALAEAELEYNAQHISKSIFVKFPLLELENTCALIWTTTPWTIPANEGIAFNPTFNYIIVNDSLHGKLLLAEDLFESLKDLIPNSKVIDVISGDSLGNLTALHPIFESKHIPFLPGDFVTSASGTGLVHSAPGHGMEDFSAWLKYKHSIDPDWTISDILSPVDDHGCFTDQVNIPELVGENVFDSGNNIVLDILSKNESLVGARDYVHKYPYDWRSKKPVLLRATTQWFASLNKLIPLALEASSQVEMIPSVSRSRLESMISSRTDWCISRQRSWGVPIPVFYERETGNPVLNDDTMSHIIRLVGERGTDVWFSESLENLLPEGYDYQKYEKCTDTMDVWFDSGTSWAGALIPRGVKTQADVYLEGSDQHRGWFQSTMLTFVSQFLDDITKSSDNSSAQTRKIIPPYKKLVTHGFTLDEQGKKMSKSIGNIVEPSSIIQGNPKQKIPPLGADVLRLWVASSEFSRDIGIGPQILTRTGEMYRKLRNTLRFCLGNLYHAPSHLSFAPDKVTLESIDPISQALLSRLVHLEKDILEGYNNQDFRKTFSLLNNISSFMSSFYFERSKDILYSHPNDSPLKISTWTTLAIFLRFFTRYLAPIIPFSADSVSKHVVRPEQYLDTNLDLSKYEKLLHDDRTVHHMAFLYEPIQKLPESWANPQLEKEFDQLLKVRDEIFIEIEKMRQSKMISSSSELVLRFFNPLNPLFSDYLAFGTSKVVIENTQSSFSWKLELAKDHDLFKCPRCWLSRSHKAEHLCEVCIKCA